MTTLFGNSEASASGSLSSPSGQSGIRKEQVSGKARSCGSATALEAADKPEAARIPSSVRALSAASITVGSAMLAGSMLLAFGRLAMPHAVHAAGDSSSEAAKLQFYKTSAEPVLRTNCYRCHAGLNRRGGLQMDTRDGLLRGGHDGAAIVPGHPEQSLLIKLIRHEGPKDDPMPMPPKGDKLSDADIATVTQWISDGAVMDR